MDIIDRFIRDPYLSREEYAALLQASEEPQAAARLAAEALRLRRKYYGDAVYVRGLIEFTNYCKNDCLYCGIRRSNREAQRYRLSEEEILSCCGEGWRLGFRTFVLQGGEDPWYTDERLERIIRSIKERCPGCAVTLSVGERSRESYQRLREAGADRYLLRHETASDAHYRRLHPAEMSPAHRKRCLYQLKALGYQAGAGFMVGSPGQTYAELAEDLVFLGELKPQMAGIGPFVPHHNTPFRNEPAGSVELTLRLLSMVRILLPRVLLPATTALGTMDPLGREKGFAAGANVLMPNLSPAGRRKQYDLYDNKLCTGDEAAESLADLKKRVEAAGWRLSMERGDAAEEREDDT